MERVAALIKLAELKVKNATVRLAEARTEMEEAEKAMDAAQKHAEQVASDVIIWREKVRQEMGSAPASAHLLESYRFSNKKMNNKLIDCQNDIKRRHREFEEKQQAALKCRLDLLANQGLLQRREEFLKKVKISLAAEKEISEEIGMEELVEQKSIRRED